MEGLIPCPHCDGQGVIAERIHVYEDGCGNWHPDIEEHRCEECAGTGQIMEECEAAGQERTL